MAFDYDNSLHKELVTLVRNLNALLKLAIEVYRGKQKSEPEIPNRRPDTIGGKRRP